MGPGRVLGCEGHNLLQAFVLLQFLWRGSVMTAQEDNKVVIIVCESGGYIMNDNTVLKVAAGHFVLHLTKVVIA